MPAVIDGKNIQLFANLFWIFKIKDLYLGNK